MRDVVLFAVGFGVGLLTEHPHAIVPLLVGVLFVSIAASISDSEEDS